MKKILKNALLIENFVATKGVANTKDLRRCCLLLGCGLFSAGGWRAGQVRWNGLQRLALDGFFLADFEQQPRKIQGEPPKNRGVQAHHDNKTPEGGAPHQKGGRVKKGTFREGGHARKKDQ